jgi:hypothetical protein
MRSTPTYDHIEEGRTHPGGKNDINEDKNEIKDKRRRMGGYVAPVVVKNLLARCFSVDVRYSIFFTLFSLVFSLLSSSSSSHLSFFPLQSLHLLILVTPIAIHLFSSSPYPKI